MSRRQHSQRGLTLIELLAALIVFSVVATLAAQAYVATRRAAMKQTAEAELVAQQVAALRLLERDALSATRVLYRLGPYRRDAQTLILERPTAPRRVVYRLDGGGCQVLVRETFDGDADQPPATTEVIAEGLSRAEFSMEGRLVRVRGELARREGERLLAMPFDAAFCLRPTGPAARMAGGM